MMSSSDENEDPLASTATEDGNTPIGNVRGEAITSLGKSMLFELISKHIHIIECKKTDFGTLNLKNKAWIEVWSAFSASYDGQAKSLNQLQNVWKNSKKTAKKVSASHKRKLFKTGGGLMVPPIPKDTQKILSLIPTQMVPLRNPYDCDSLINDDLSKTQDLLIAKQVETVKESSANTTYTTNSTEESVSTKNKEKRQYKDARSSLVDMEYEEHKIRLNILQLKKDNLLFKRKAAEDLASYAKEEHLLKMQVLNLEAMKYNGPHPF